MERHVVLYDGECFLCSESMRRLLAWDRKRVFEFAPIQGETGAAALARHSVQGDRLQGIWLVEGYQSANERLYGRSEALLAMARHLGGFWRLGLIAKAIPRRWRDALYEVVARNRYRWFGRNPSCGLVSVADRERFLP